MKILMTLVYFTCLRQISCQPGKVGNGGPPVRGSTYGTVYTRWGRTKCPTTSHLVYWGYAAKSKRNEGGGVNYICLSREPTFFGGSTTTSESRSTIYGVEYKVYNQQEGQWSPLLNKKLHHGDVPCAVCEVNGRSKHIMLPGTYVCPSGWVREYYGYLVSQRFNHKGSTFVCLDGKPAKTGSSKPTAGGRFYAVEGSCGSLPCPPYKKGFELSCAVCTK